MEPKYLIGSTSCIMTVLGLNFISMFSKKCQIYQILKYTKSFHTVLSHIGFSITETDLRQMIFQDSIINSISEMFNLKTKL